MNQEQLRRIVVWQYALVLITGIAAFFIAENEATLSALAGGLCVAVPNSALAFRLIVAMNNRIKLRPMTVIVGELLKMIATCLLFLLVAKFYEDLNWLAMIAGIIAAVFGQFVLIFIKH